MPRSALRVVSARTGAQQATAEPSKAVEGGTGSGDAEDLCLWGLGVQARA